jgi:hypothetical protein
VQDNAKHGQRAQTQSRVAREALPLTKRAAYSPAEFAASCGRHPSWAYRLLYGGKVRALTDLGRILIPASELERILATATPYNPQPPKNKAKPVAKERGRGGGKSGHWLAILRSCCGYGAVKIAWAVFQRLMLTGEQSGLLTRIATMESGSLCTPMKY